MDSFMNSKFGDNFRQLEQMALLTYMTAGKKIKVNNIHETIFYSTVECKDENT